MMFKKAFLLFILVFAASSYAQEAGYQEIKPPQPVQNPDKIEVMEFFWYGCPHCYSLEPELEHWLKTLPDDVVFIRQPAIFSDLWGKHAKAYYVAEALGVVNKVHADFFDAIQNKKQKLTSEDDLAEFFMSHGVEEKAFRDAYNSFLVDARVRQAKAMPPRYGITGLPALIVNGKYKTNGSLAKSQKNMISVINELIEKERAARLGQ